VYIMHYTQEILKRLVGSVASLVIARDIQEKSDKFTRCNFLIQYIKQSKYWTDVNIFFILNIFIYLCNFVLCCFRRSLIY
jgi:hypothetical protein